MDCRTRRLRGGRRAIAAGNDCVHNPVEPARDDADLLASPTTPSVSRQGCRKLAYAHRGGEYRQKPKCHSFDYLVTPGCCQLTNSLPCAVCSARFRLHCVGLRVQPAWCLTSFESNS